MSNREDLVYRTYSTYLKETFGHKVYKIPLSLPAGCPNRDGTLGRDGCTFCGDEGGAFEGLSDAMSLREQFHQNAALIQRKYHINHFAAYFQRFTNTYMDLEELKQILDEVEGFGVEGIILSTRPDCLPDEQLSYFEELNRRIPVTLELGLQTTNYHILDEIGRGHGLAEYVDAVLRARRRDLRICTHLMLNLPGETDRDAVEAAKFMNVLGVEEVKLHALYIVEDTAMGRAYKEGKLNLGTLEEYKRRVMLFLRHLSPEVVVQRIIGRAPEEGTLFVNWNTSWWKIRDEIVEEMLNKGFKQGDLVQSAIIKRKNSCKSNQDSI